MKKNIKTEYDRVKKIKEGKESLKVLWKDDVDKDDYDAAYDYLDLVISDKVLLKSIIKKLKGAKLVTKKAKDILRASRLNRLGMDNIHIQHNINKYKMGIKLSPILLVRGIRFCIDYS